MFNLENDLETLKHIIDSSNRITFFTGAGVSVASGVPDFRSMGGLFDEISKDQPTIIRALNKIEHADTLVVLGSSLVVQPAAGLISNFKGDNLIIINKDRTPYDSDATLVIHDDMVSVVKSLITG